MGGNKSLGETARADRQNEQNNAETYRIRTHQPENCERSFSRPCHEQNAEGHGDVPQAAS